EEVRRIRFVDEDLQRDAQLLAVVEDPGVRVRNAPRADVEMLSVVERAHLTFTLWTNLGVLAAASDRPRESADAVARLENADVVSELGELVRGHQPGDAGADDDDPGVAWPARELWTFAGLAGHQIPRRHRRHDER